MEGEVEMYMKLKDGKSKVITFSYDDGGIEDTKLVEIFNKYSLKCTFNINTGLYMPESETRDGFRGSLKLSEAQNIYMNSGHEVAVHAYTHAFLDRIKPDEVLEQVLLDRKNIEQQFKSFARGMAYPYGAYNDDVVRLLEDAGICYSRTTKPTETFFLPQNWLMLHPTCHHNHPNLMNLAEKFVNEKPRYISDNWMFYIWGHSWEFVKNNNWNLMEELAELVSFKDDIWYATNIEIYDYVKAYERLITSVDKKIIYNPSAIDVWVDINGETYCIHGGETLYL